MYNEFLVETKYCDVGNPEIQRRAKYLCTRAVGLDRLGLSSCDGNQTFPKSLEVLRAIQIFNWVRDSVKYSFDFWNVKASDTLRKMQGMCANKANLQIAMLRTAGIPAGYGILRIKKDAIKVIAEDEIYDKSAESIIHVYCRVFLNGRWISADATVDSELYETAYINVPDWKHGNWDGQKDIQMSPVYVLEDLGIKSNIDEYMDIPPRFLNDDILKKANDYIETLRKRR